VTAPNQAPNQDIQLRVRLRRDERGVVLQVVGEVDLLTGDQFRDALEQAMENPPQVLVVDLTDVAFLCSLAWSLLISAAHATVLRIVPGPVARRKIELVGLSGLLPMYTTVDAALDAPQ
jgi:anti-anti-sigma factor